MKAASLALAAALALVPLTASAKKYCYYVDGKLKCLDLVPKTPSNGGGNGGGGGAGGGGGGTNTSEPPDKLGQAKWMKDFTLKHDGYRLKPDMQQLIDKYSAGSGSGKISIPGLSGAGTTKGTGGM